MGVTFAHSRSKTHSHANISRLFEVFKKNLADFLRHFVTMEILGFTISRKQQSKQWSGSQEAPKPGLQKRQNAIRWKGDGISFLKRQRNSPD